MLRTMFLLSLLAACEPARDVEPAEDVQAERLVRQPATRFAQLREASRSPVRVRASEGVLTSARLNVPAPTTSPEPVDQAFAFLAVWGDLYGVTRPEDELFVVSSVSDEDGDHVVVRRRQGDVPFLDGDLAVHLHRGSVRSTLGHLPAAVASFAGARLSLEDAASSAARSRAGGEAIGAPQLGVARVLQLDGTYLSALVYRVRVGSNDRRAPGQWSVDVDAATGDVLQSISLVTDADIRIETAQQNGIDIISCWTFADDEDWFDESGPLAAYNVNLDLGNDAFEAWGWALSVWSEHAAHNWDGWNDNSAQLVALTHANLNGTVGSAAPGCSTIQFEDNWVDRDVVTHEFTHMVDANSSNLAYTWLTGALDESFADVAGAHADQNWTFGEVNGGLRSLKSPALYGDPDHVLLANSADNSGLRPQQPGNTDNQWVHTNSGIPNKVGYLVTAGDTHQGYSTVGLGFAKARWFYHRTQVSGFQGVQNFVDARDAFVAKGELWVEYGIHGFTAQDLCDVKNAWASVGVDTSGSDQDCDGIEDGQDADVDDDGIDDSVDNCPGVDNTLQTDTDGQGKGDACDLDDDGDGWPDTADDCPLVADDQQDSDNDGFGDVCDDSDLDGQVDTTDNCDQIYNPNQLDTDGDGIGDLCDADQDDDGVPGSKDNCPFVENPDQADQDSDGVGDACDNCEVVPNPSQTDCDGDGIGSACEDSIEGLGCYDLSRFVEFHPWVHPLDLVSIPALDDLAFPDGATVTLNVRPNARVPELLVVDATGQVVTRSLAGRDGSFHLSYRPEAAFRLPETGERAPWSNAYSLRFPDVGDTGGFEVAVEISVEP